MKHERHNEHSFLIIENNYLFYQLLLIHRIKNIELLLLFMINKCPYYTLYNTIFIIIHYFITMN